MAQPSASTSPSTTIAEVPSLVDEDFVREHTYVMRGQKVTLDRDLAKIYGYETRYLNRQVQNNREKFAGLPNAAG